MHRVWLDTQLLFLPTFSHLWSAVSSFPNRTGWATGGTHLSLSVNCETTSALCESTSSKPTNRVLQAFTCLCTEYVQTPFTCHLFYSQRDTATISTASASLCFTSQLGVIKLYRRIYTGDMPVIEYKRLGSLWVLVSMKVWEPMTQWVLKHSCRSTFTRLTASSWDQNEIMQDWRYSTVA